MKKKNRTKAIGKSLRKTMKRHSIATGVLTGAATAVALSTSGATRKFSDALGSGVASLLKAGGKRNEAMRNLKKLTAAALVRAGQSLDPEPELPVTDAKVSTATRRSAASRASA